MNMKRIAVAALAGTIALLSAVLTTAAPALADPAPEGPVNRTVLVDPVPILNVVHRSCGATEVWGVAAGPGTPEYTWGNYQVCHYGSSVVEPNLSDNYTDDDHLVDAAVRRRANAEAAARSFLSYCPYWLPGGPNRTPSVNYLGQSFQVLVVDTYPDGHQQVVSSGTASMFKSSSVTWTPTCNTH